MVMPYLGNGLCNQPVDFNLTINLLGMITRLEIDAFEVRRP
jgi:hypothetical protein